MKTSPSSFSLRITLALTAMLFWASSLADGYTISETQALNIAKAEFPNDSVDYYLVQNGLNSSWTIFVDADPLAGWEHDCYTIIVPKTSNLPAESLTPGKVHQRIPPSYPLTPLCVQERPGPLHSPEFPITISPHSGPTPDNPLADKTYAVIISGGLNPNANRLRYWNDCSFLYQTLTKTYGVPKSHIYPLMADGVDPANDIHLGQDSYCSQNLDLDDDGEDEISLSASHQNIAQVLSTLCGTLDEDCHLLFYVIDHGGYDDIRNESYICLWNEEKLYSTDLAGMMMPFSYSKVNVNVVMGQCNSGGFVEGLSNVGCVVTTACAETEWSYATGDLDFDQFVYDWTCAINKGDHLGRALPSCVDKDGDGHVSMLEAFQYARPRSALVHPQYTSTPYSIGEELAFDRFPPKVDIYIKDNPEDTGKEPNYLLEKDWLSPSIWVRNNDDNGTVHENPYVSSTHPQAYVYVKVHNRGKKNYLGDKYLIVYWSYASAGFTAKAWKGLELDQNQRPMGGYIDAVSINPIASGDSLIVKVPWNLPNRFPGIGNTEVHACLLARIMDEPYDDGYEEDTHYFDVKAYNDQAQKNITIVSTDNADTNVMIVVRNIDKFRKDYTLEIVPHLPNDSLVFTHSNVELTLTPNLYNAWRNGGFSSVDVTLLNSPSTQQHRLKFNSPRSKLQNIILNAEQAEKVGVIFNFSNHEPVGDTYTVDLIQRTGDGEIIGGETFVVKSPNHGRLHLRANYDITDDGVELSIGSTEMDNVLWYSEDNELIGNQASVLVEAQNRTTTYQVVGYTDSGEMASECIEIPPLRGINNLAVLDNTLRVSLNSEATSDCTLCIYSLSTQSLKLSSTMETASKTADIDISALGAGTYVVAYMQNGSLIDSKTFVKSE